MDIDEVNEGETLTCTKDGPECEGAVGWHESFATGVAHRWCEHHWGEICQAYDRTRELFSPTPAPWFDPDYAGESWGEDDW